MSLLESHADVLSECVEIRHDLHRNPELGYQEHRTSGLVRQTLTDLGIDHRGGLGRGTGVAAWLPASDGGADAKTVALRADMDALPIVEETGLPYASQTSGVMHACGHDGHTAILLGVARVLSRSVRPHHVLLLFQPAEEGGAGARAMCEDGVLEGKVLGRPVDEIFGLHGYPMGELGHVYTRNGPLMAAASEFHIHIHGKGTHAAYPHFGVDPIVVGAHVIVALQPIASRNVDPLESIVITVGKVEAGVAHNVIPESATMKGTLRALNDATNELGKRRIGEVVEHVAMAMGATATVEWVGAYPVVINDPDATDVVRRITAEVIGVHHLHEMKHPSMGGEDFSFYGQLVPSCFFFLGLRPPDKAVYPNLHAPDFDFNDAAIPYGIELMCALATN